MIESSETANTNPDQTEKAAPGSPNGQNESADAIDSLKKRTQELEAQLKEKDAKYLYLYAEFENFKKRAIKERSDLVKFGWESTARELLLVIDNLERALVHMPPETDKTLKEGLGMILTQFRATLEKQGVQTVESLEKDFDPNLHEAVGQEISELPAGKILKEHMRGYTLHGRLLRPARVIVSGGQATTNLS